MDNTYYYLVFGIIVYLLFTHILENYINHENFDPSLVPVSSIVSLAKQSQKLLNGNGTLTNPSNLQIGTSPSASGSLKVKGDTSVSGNTILNTLTTTGSTNLSNLEVSENSTIDGILTTGNNTTSPQFHTSGSSGAYYINPRSGTGSYAWYNPSGSSTNLFSDVYKKDVVTIDNTETTNMINANASGTLSVTGTSTLNTTNISGNLTATGASNNFKNGTIGTSHFPYTDGVNYIRGDLRINNDTTVNGVIKSGHTFYATVTMKLEGKGATQDIYLNSPLIPNKLYFAEAHVHFTRTGSGYDGVALYFFQNNVIGLPSLMGFNHNRITFDGIQQTGWGWVAPRTSAIAVITGPTINLRAKVGNDDFWTITVLIVVKPI